MDHNDFCISYSRYIEHNIKICSGRVLYSSHQLKDSGIPLEILKQLNEESKPVDIMNDDELDEFWNKVLLYCWQFMEEADWIAVFHPNDIFESTEGVSLSFKEELIELE